MVFFLRRRVVPRNATFRLTQQGTDKVQEFGGDPGSRILAALESNGTSNINEISLNSQLSRGKVESKIPSLVKGGYIQYVSSSSGVDDE